MGKRSILEGVSLSLLEGLTFIAGLNGSGKSTILRAILGLVPASGSIMLDGKDLLKMPARERAGLIALLHQRITTGFSENVLHFVRMGRFPHLGTLEHFTPADTAKAELALAQVGAEDLAARLTDSLSGGELQKVLLARALCQEAKVLLLDEPATYLDPKNSAMLNGLIRQLANEGRMVICVTHDTASFAVEGARILGLREGKVVLDCASGPDARMRLDELVYC